MSRRQKVWEKGLGGSPFLLDAVTVVGLYSHSINVGARRRTPQLEARVHSAS